MKSALPLPEEVVAELAKRRLRHTTVLKTGKKARYLPMFCDNCAIADRCPYYKAGAVCKLRKEIRKYIEKYGRDAEAIKNALFDAFEIVLERAYLATAIENAEGGVPSKVGDRNWRLVKDFGKVLAEFFNPKAVEMRVLEKKSDELFMKILKVYWGDKQDEIEQMINTG